MIKVKYIIFCFILITASIIIAGDKDGEQIGWQVLSGGGSLEGTSTSFRLASTAAETAVGSGTSDNFRLYHGFLQNLSVSNILCGDVNDDGVVNLLDILYFIDWKYKHGTPPVNMSTADVNSDGAFNLLDILYLIDFKYKNGPEPDCP